MSRDCAVSIKELTLTDISVIGLSFYVVQIRTVAGFYNFQHNTKYKLIQCLGTECYS